MQSRTVAAAILLVLLGFVVAVQLADPQLGERSPPDVDFSDPPSEIAADAATQFEYIDYSYRIDFRRNRTDDWRQVRTMQVDHTDREYYKTGPNGEDGVVIYGNDAVTFVRPGDGNPWRVTAIQDATYPAPAISQPFRVDEIRRSNSTIVSDNFSTAVINLPIHPVKIAQLSTGQATLWIHKQTGLIEYARITYSPDKSQRLYLYFQLTATEIDVDRPKGVKSSPREFFWDIIRGPIFSPF